MQSEVDTQKTTAETNAEKYKRVEEECRCVRLEKAQLQRELKAQEIRHMESLVSLRKKFDAEKTEWQSLLREEKEHMKLTHCFAMRELENSFQHKLFGLESELETLRAKQLASSSSQREKAASPKLLKVLRVPKANHSNHSETSKCQNHSET